MPVRILAIFVVCFGFTHTVRSSTILDFHSDYQGFAPAVVADQYVQVSFGLPQTYSNVEVLVYIASWTPNVSFTGTGFLTSDTGPGAHPPAIASNSYRGVTNSFATAQSILLFPGLTLGPGAYYLTLASSDVPFGAGLWWGTGFPPESVAPGVTWNGATYAASGLGAPPNPAYPPASRFVSFSTEIPYVQYTVTGEPVPEPSTLGLAFVICCSAICVLGRKRLSSRT